jgi:hypothetical protein
MTSNTQGVLTTTSDNSQNGLSSSSRVKAGSARPTINEQTSVRKSEIVNVLFGEVGDIVDG